MKIAISVPDPVFEAGEHLARQLGISRSQLYSDALAQYLTTRGAAEVTARLNRVYSTERSEIEPALMRAQLQTLDDEAW
jgi:metal-responsive CopG/Arc/MetJ family transcriptional regulator